MDIGGVQRANDKPEAAKLSFPPPIFLGREVVTERRDMDMVAVLETE